MSPFQPASDRARWRVLYELLAKLGVGDLLPYAAMAEALELDPDADRHKMQLAMRRAAQELEEVDKRAVEPVPNVGYMIVAPNEHVALARQQQRKSNRALARGHSKVVNVDFNQMEPEARKAIELMASTFAAQMDFNRRMDVRQANLEQAIAAVTKRADQQAERTDAQLVTLKERLARLEAQRTS